MDYKKKYLKYKLKYLTAKKLYGGSVTSADSPDSAERTISDHSVASAVSDRSYNCGDGYSDNAQKLRGLVDTIINFLVPDKNEGSTSCPPSPRGNSSPGDKESSTSGQMVYMSN